MTSTEVDLIRLWRLDCEGRGISELVIKHYENYLREYRRDAWPLLGSTTFDLSSFLLERSGRWAPATRMYARRAFRSFFRFAVEAGALDEDPAGTIDARKSKNGRPRTAADRRGMVQDLTDDHAPALGVRCKLALDHRDRTVKSDWTGT